MIKKILITGGAGYIGSHVTEVLIKNKKKIFIIDNLSTGFKKLINKKATFYKANVLKPELIKKIIIQNKIDSVIHLAGSLIIGTGEKKPKLYYKNNVLGTKSILAACKNTSVKNFIFSSTAAVYKDGQKIVHEKSKVQPKSVYGKTKVKAERLIISNCKKFGINYAILRYFNVCGASFSGKIGLISKTDSLFKNISAAVIKENPIVNIYGNNYKTPDGTAIRDYIHVSDLADIHYRILKKISKMNKSMILNCGYNKGVSVNAVINEFKNQSKKKISILYKKQRPGDLSMVIANNKKLIRTLKWKPKYFKLSTIIKSCIKWEKTINR
jgi:UDP-glucose 4-epimerase|tara:strand:+ start:323 stop:1300 length:978 start_codon:yes stop_codon:yes gene_type:complete